MWCRTVFALEVELVHCTEAAHKMLGADPLVLAVVPAEAAVAVTAAGMGRTAASKAEQC